MFKMYYIQLLLLVLIFKPNCFESSCVKQEYCGECISFAAETCVWCMGTTTADSNCGTSEHDISWCNGKIYPEKNNKLGKIRKSNGSNQFKPAILDVILRPGEEISFDFEFTPIEDYPLDVYYLLDNSYTMHKHKQVLTYQAETLHSTLSNYSNNVRFGVGTFVEKPAVPYTLKFNKAYSFKNDLSLTDNMNTFSEIVKKIEPASNLDDPEASFDALMQVMVCKKQIGWREDAYRIIVLCTDNTYHSAGDGKIVGAFKPNNMNCHLDDNGVYTEALKYDYPSVGQINKFAKENRYFIIFAVSKFDNDEQVYQALEKRVKWSVYRELNNKSDIVDIIVSEYQKKITKLQINKIGGNDVQLTMNPNCLDGCDIKHREVKKVNVTLKAKTCLKQNETIELNAFGGIDTLIISVNTICKCPCEDNDKIQFNSTKCNKKGDYECGVCKCNKNRSGKNCNCDANSTSDNRNDIANCKKFVNDTNPCSGRGDCRCGSCSCIDGFSGTFCEYDDNACYRYKDKLCAGHGKCYEGLCHCYDSWTGENCGCPDHDRNCYAPRSKEVCSGNGKCNCGVCECNVNVTAGNNKTYSGKFCDLCDNCEVKRCKELDEYINKQCVVDPKLVCNKSEEVFIEMLDKDTINAFENTKWCYKTIVNGCSIVYKYNYDVTDQLHLYVQSELDCPAKEDIWIPIAAAIASILLIGLLTAIIWKCLVDVHDKREFQKFSKEAAAAGWDVSLNPLYEHPETNFINPTFEASQAK